MSRTIARLLLLTFACGLAAPRALAHDPLDISSRLVVYGDRIELTSTLGIDAARHLLGAAGCTREKISEALRSRGPDDVVEHPLALAQHLFQIAVDSAPAQARKITSLAEGMEVVLTVAYARPPGSKLEIHAACYEAIPELKKGVLRVAHESGRSLGAALFWPDNKRHAVALTATAATPVQNGSPRPSK